ncbi:MAG TPA: CBS domain-containing protein [Flavisolibacter sp.]|jgi:signal-transduction protein with cAMP-binding, CBS, and nucleotidyltransferase domain|nr:CBS domain-containing protein [Flavisolibacter sp.]
MEQVADLLTRIFPQFNTAASSCLVSDALYKMCSENVDYLIIMEDNKFMGVITDHDIASRILFENRPLNQIAVKEYMNTNLPVVRPESSLHNCMKMMERYNVRHLAIYDNFDFKGVVSSYELMQEALQKQSSLSDQQEPPRQGYPWNY